MARHGDQRRVATYAKYAGVLIRLPITC